MRADQRKAIGFIGYSNSGKTTLIEKLVPRFRAQGLTVSAIKNAHHGFDMDRPGKDSYRYREAGAGQVLISTTERWALLTETPVGHATLEDLLARLDPCDLVIVEGYKRDTHDKIEVRNLALAHPELAGDDPTIVAIAANGTLDDAPVPLFDRDDVSALASFIERHTGLA